MRGHRAVLLFVMAASVVSAQSTPPDAVTAVLQRDDRFWKAYNACDVKAMAEFFTDDVEFYHDRGGTTLGLSNLAGVFRDRLCNNPDSRLRREAVAGTVAVFPMKNGDALYGAVLSGEHLFYVVEKGKPEPTKPDGRARFTHLWLSKNGEWKMSRVLSYDHRPVDK